MPIDTVTLLEADEPAPFETERRDGASPFFLACDHASRYIPRRLGTLGLDESELGRHIAWDIGAAAVASGLSRILDATLVRQGYSRLVIDCNRPLDVDNSIVRVSEHTTVPGNLEVSPQQAEARAREIFHPYHDTIGLLLDEREERGQESVLVTVHSFTPVFKGFRRPWHIGMIYGRDRRLADELYRLLDEEGDLVVGDNEPYTVSDTTDYTIPVHGERRGLPYVQLEIRQDVIEHAAGQQEWSDRLGRLLPEALARFRERWSGP